MTSSAIKQSVAFLRSWLTYQSHQQNLPGFAVAICYKEQLIFSEAFGWADVAAKERLTPAHLFQIGSQAKMFTMLAILQLSRELAIPLSTPACHIIPWLAQHADRRFRLITIEQLLWHGAGLIRDGYPADYWQLQMPFPDKRALQQLVLASELLYEPGARFKYSNLGYALLGQIVEKMAGETYTAFVGRHILGVNFTGIQPYTPTLSSVAQGYLPLMQAQRIPVTTRVPTHAFESVAGWYASAPALCRFLTTFFKDGKYAFEEQNTALASPGRRGHWIPPVQRGTEYGWGFLPYNYQGHRLIGHSGSFIGHHTYGYCDPQQEIAVVVLTNAKDAPVHHMAEGIIGTLDYFSEYGTTTPSAEQARFNGRLMNLWQTLDIVATKDRVVSVNPDAWAPFEVINEELIPTGEASFRISQANDLATLDEKVTFYFDKADVLTHVNYAGSTTLPEPIYLRHIRDHQKTIK